MLSLAKTIQKLSRNRAHWAALLREQKLSRSIPQEMHTAGLTETTDFGSNPGQLRMLSYRPAGVADNSALVVVLHGCTQTAAAYAHGAGWQTLARRHGFALLLPEQQRTNNPNLCFNWFRNGDTTRGAGEALSIRQMVERITIDHRLDPRRIVITGLSAGGAMTSVMLATYPEIFAAGAIIAGLPYGAATNVQQAFECMFQCPARSAQTWGESVRRASSHHERWPRISIWQGDADRTVVPGNANELVKQWTNVHGLPIPPTVRSEFAGGVREEWRNSAGDKLLERYKIRAMGHGTPISPGGGEGGCGVAGPFILDVGVSSSHLISRFFGITESRNRDPLLMRESAREDGDFAWPQGGMRPDAGSSSSPVSQNIFVHQSDVGAVITRALRTAGLLKNQ